MLIVECVKNVGWQYQKEKFQSSRLLMERG